MNTKQSKSFRVINIKHFKDDHGEPDMFLEVEVKTQFVNSVIHSFRIMTADQFTDFMLNYGIRYYLEWVSKASSSDCINFGEWAYHYFDNESVEDMKWFNPFVAREEGFRYE